jgi:hypothetical protein
MGAIISRKRERVIPEYTHDIILFRKNNIVYQQIVPHNSNIKSPFHLHLTLSAKSN